MKPHALVIGAGWSGLACSIALLDAGARVTLVDAAPEPGGRARGVRLRLGDREFSLDNGQHLVIGAYRDYLALARRIGIATERLYHRQPFALRYPDGFAIVATDAPSPWHLAGALLLARGLRWPEKLAAVRWVQRQRLRRWTPAHDAPAITLFEGHPSTLIERLWQPLCLAALNLRLESASARIFLRVLGDSLDGGASASDLLVARADLSAVFAGPAWRFLQEHGAQLRAGELALALDPANGARRWLVRLRSGRLEADAVVLAVPPIRSAELLRTTCRPEVDAAVHALGQVQSAPITTVYLRYPSGTRLEHSVYCLQERPGQFGQWVFDRGRLQPENDGVLSVVISGDGPHRHLDGAGLVQSVAQQLGRCFVLPEPLAGVVLVEKRATIAALPDLVRPDVRLPLSGLYVAGDSAASPYPSTLEGSVRAGLAAARAAMEDLASAA